MKTLFLCLANSKKFGDRCLAGVEVTKSSRGYSPLLRDGAPRWIRPVSPWGGGAVASSVADNVRILDIAELDIIQKSPAGFQSENVFFHYQSLKVVDRLGPEAIQDLYAVSGYQGEMLFGDINRSIDPSRIRELDHSLALVKPEKPRPYLSGDENRLRMRFHFRGHDYNLPVTDLDFEREFHDQRAAGECPGDVLLTLSVGEAYEKKHYKLVAGVISMSGKNPGKNPLFTIGYSIHSSETFTGLLKVHGVTALADVRTTPYSQYRPEFNRETLEPLLKEQGIAYVFLGDSLGARIEAADCYTKGTVNFSLVSRNSRFKTGLSRILKGMEKFCVTLMCAEKDPIACHRTILVCRNLKGHADIRHILGDGSVESHASAEQRLMETFGLDQPQFFMTDNQRLEEAYERQGKKIAYQEAENEDPETIYSGFH